MDTEKLIADYKQLLDETMIKNKEFAGAMAAARSVLSSQVHDLTVQRDILRDMLGLVLNQLSIAEGRLADQNTVYNTACKVVEIQIKELEKQKENQHP